MLKKILIVITVILIAGVAAGLYFFTQESKYFGTSSLKAVPVETPFFVRIQNLSGFAAQTKSNPIWKEFSAFSGISDIYNVFSFADSLVNNKPEIQQLFREKPLIVVPEKGKSLYLLELGSIAEKRAIAGFLDNFFSNRQGNQQKHKLGKATVYEYTWEKQTDEKSFYISFYRGICLASDDLQLIGKAIDQLDLPSLLDDENFQKVNKTSASNIDVNLYINHKFFPNSLVPLLAEKSANLVGKTRYGLWSEIDLTQKPDRMLFNGFSYSDGSSNNFLDLFLDQKPQTFSMEEYLPARTSFFITLNLENLPQYLKNYQMFLEKQGLLDKYLSKLDDAKTALGINLVDFTIENMDREAGVVFIGDNQLIDNENQIFLMKVKSGGNAESILNNAVKSYSAKNGIKDASQFFRIDQETSFDISKMPVIDFGQRIFGSLFSNIETCWFTVYDNCLVMGASYDAICSYLRSVLLKETLSNSASYLEFAAGLSKRSSLYLWISPGRAYPHFKAIIDQDVYKTIVDGAVSLNKIEAAGWQFGTENGMVYNMADLKYNPVVEEKSSTEWRSHLGSRVINQPQFVTSSEDKSQKELVFQDAENNFYLVNFQGRILWKIKLQNPILGEVKQIDFFKDGKLQLLFNTKEAIHLIDQNGNYIQNYPLSLRANATNGLSVFDYENKRDYRFCIACDDRKVYMYDKAGKTVAGWSPEKIEHDILQPVQHIRSGTKDYVVFFDREKSYILDRQGKIRVRSKAKFTHSKNDFMFDSSKGNGRLVTTDIDGTIWFLNLDESFEKLSVGKFSADHFFAYEDVSGDKKPDFIFFDNQRLFVFDSSAKEIFSKSFDNIELPPYIVAVGNSKKIAVVSADSNQVFLLNGDGSLYRDFPLEGNSPVNIGSFGLKNKTMNLIVGSSDGFLNNYTIK